MHELSIAENLLQLLEEQAVVKRFHKVAKVTLRIGRLSHVSVDALVFCFDAVTLGTVAEGATLEVLHEAGMALCPACGKEAPAAEIMDECPFCGAVGRRITGGRDITLAGLEVRDY
jgi:hydrogenase nickel incorporation protein HypA/HybF